MDLRYEEWPPTADGLKGVVTAYWQVEGDASQVPSSAILPDGYVELVFNLGAPVGLAGPAYTGDQPARAVVGILSHAIQMKYRGPVKTFGIRFHPARGPAFFGQPAAAITDKLLSLEKVSASLDQTFSLLFTRGWDPESESSRAALDTVLLQQLSSSSSADASVIAIVDHLTASDLAPSVAQMARELGLSARQLQRRFVSAVGVPPKQFLRVFRFARLWQMATMGTPDTWASLAAQHGYADQAHMVREFRAFGVNPPTHFFTPDWYDTTKLTRLPELSKNSPTHVRSVQDRSARRR